LPSQFRPSFSFSSAFWVGNENSFHRSSLLVHLNSFTPFYRGYNIHVLIQNIHFIIAPTTFIVDCDWAICGPQNFTLKDSKIFSVRCT
jgi:hypothetical protein